MTGNSSDLPLVTLCVAAWNAEEFIVNTLQSLTMQTWSNLEVLVSDDVSTDNTATLCKQFAASDNRFRVIRQTKNLGWVGNMNAMLQQARGEFISMVPHDDLMAPDCVRRLVEVLQQNANASVAFSDIDVLMPDGKHVTYAYPELDGIVDPVKRGVEMIHLRGNWWIPYHGMYRAQTVREIGGLKRHGAGEFSADFLWVFRLALMGECIRIPENLYCKIIAKTSLSRTWKYGNREWFHLACAARREIHAAPLTWRQKTKLESILLKTMMRWIRNSVSLRVRGHRRTQIP